MNQTGCIGCPYGMYKGNTKKELELVSKARYEYCWKCFGKSYLVRGLKKQQQIKVVLGARTYDTKHNNC